MSEFYVKSVELSTSAESVEQILCVVISSFKGRSGVELTAEHEGEIIASERINLSIGENRVDLFIKESPVQRKIMLKLSYRGFPAGSYEADISPPTL